VSDQGITTLKGLHCLNVSENLNITDEGIHSLLTRSPDLQCLHLENCRSVSQQSIPLLTKHGPNLRRLNVSGISLHADYFATNLQLQNLVDLTPGASLAAQLTTALPTLLDNCPALRNLCLPNVEHLYRMNGAHDLVARVVLLMPELEGIYDVPI
jgi:hypothetical protein